MNNSNLPDNQFSFIWKLFYMDKPIGKIIFFLLAFLGSAFYFKLIPWPFVSEKDCDGRPTLVGTLLNEKTRTPLEQVTAHFATFAKDETDSHGMFSVEGVEIPESKIISLRVEFSGGKQVEIESVDLRNSVKYPVKDCKIDLGQILVSLEKAKYSPISSTQIEASKNNKTSTDYPDSSPSSVSSYFNEEKTMQIAVLSAGKSEGLSVSNLKNSIVERWISEGLSTSISLFRPGFYAQFANSLENDDLTALKASGLGSRTACLCFLNIENIKSEKETLETDGEKHFFEKVSGTLDVKFYAINSGTISAFTINETGAGGNRKLALESLTDKFITQFFNHKLSLGVCKN